MLSILTSPFRVGAMSSVLMFVPFCAAAQQAQSAESVVVTGTLDQAREQIAPALGAVVHTIGPEAIAAIPQGSDAAFSQVLLRAPGVVADSLGEVHVRGEHGDLTYRLNGVLLPEGLNGFGQEIDTRLIDSVKLIDGTLPAQFGFRTAGIVDIKTKSGAQFDGTEIGLSGGGAIQYSPLSQRAERRQVSIILSRRPTRTTIWVSKTPPRP